MTIAEDAVVEANREMLLQRSIFGINKYGITLEKSGLDERQLVVHALEEALDLANYLQAQLMRIDAKPRTELRAGIYDAHGNFIAETIIVAEVETAKAIADQWQKEEQQRNFRIAGLQNSKDKK